MKSHERGGEGSKEKKKLARGRGLKNWQQLASKEAQANKEA